MLPTEECGGFRFDCHLQHVPRKPADEADHRRLGRADRRFDALQRTLDFCFQLDARWYSLHGVDLLPTRYQRADSGLNHQEDTNASLLLQEV
jgi:hypothetical protein